MLKQVFPLDQADLLNLRQPPLGGCVLKHGTAEPFDAADDQPPLGGCVLKPLAVKAKASVGTSRL